MVTAFRAQLRVLRLDRFPVPFRIAEVVIRLDEIVDCEVVLLVVEPGAATDDLLRDASWQKVTEGGWVFWWVASWFMFLEIIE